LHYLDAVGELGWLVANPHSIRLEPKNDPDRSDDEIRSGMLESVRYLLQEFQDQGLDPKNVWDRFQVDVQRPRRLPPVNQYLASLLPTWEQVAPPSPDDPSSSPGEAAQAPLFP
jgi:hypothetical protein